MRLSSPAAHLEWMDLVEIWMLDLVTENFRTPRHLFEVLLESILVPGLLALGVVVVLQREVAGMRAQVGRAATRELRACCLFQT
jgi:hypothetical protein